MIRSLSEHYTKVVTDRMIGGNNERTGKNVVQLDNGHKLMSVKD